MQHARVACFWFRTVAFTRKTIRNSRSSRRIASSKRRARSYVPEALTEKYVTVPNEATAKLPADFEQFHQIVLEKQTLDIFESHHAETLLGRLPRDAEFVVFGVVTEFCVRLAAKGLLERGRRVAVVSDAIETLNKHEARRTMAELRALGATTITTSEALRRLDDTAAAEAKSRAPSGS